MSKLNRRQFGKWVLKGGILVPFAKIISPSYGQIIRRSSLLVPLNSGGGGTPVSFDTKFQDGTASVANPFSLTSNTAHVAGTIGANSNRVLIGTFALNQTGTTAASMTWGGVSMTAIGTKITVNSAYDMYMFGLINPASGNAVLSFTWTGATGGSAWLSGLSFYNVNQSTGWQNNGSDTGTGTSASSTVTSANNNMVAGFLLNDNASSTTISGGTSDWVDERFSGNTAAGHRASSGSSTVISWTLGSSVAWGILKTDLLAA